MNTRRVLIAVSLLAVIAVTISVLLAYFERVHFSERLQQATGFNGYVSGQADGHDTPQASDTCYTLAVHTQIYMRNGEVTRSVLGNLSRGLSIQFFRLHYGERHCSLYYQYFREHPEDVNATIYATE